ncbi:NAD(+) diphosphatase [Cellulomonas bogoriensis]|uniref:NAD(+) diphosphatase n=1 Tax=Cellulomonas bogoriensis 69B4 = DSM 16987 TaxID=1386082 RepID=A0A0A0BL74_9CELL|nr:NAD(+) diphosphatase [Cellulomonas bogoriensis]KGM09238.1 NUDIX hydrolase [Cellulomonas bogoriensis 69B4 = DSM 16987]
MDPARLPLSRATVDRDAARRDDVEALRAAWLDPASRVVLVRGAQVAARGAALDLRVPTDVLPELPVADPAAEPVDGCGLLVLYLGADEDHAYFALAIEGAPPACEVRDEGWVPLRDVGHVLSDRDAGLATTAVGVTAWHAHHVRCPRCGSVTVPVQGGWVRRCVQDGTDHYPRTDPAVIMAVVDDRDRLLLAHAAHWPERRFSTLAGYVEPGEPLESAVRREVGEEVGLLVGDVTYRASQPWPFPSSLMLAFVARALTTHVRVDGVEITRARWFTRAELADDVRAGRVQLPSPTSVARALVEEWFGGPVG